MWIAMGGLLGVATIVFVLGLFSAQASRRHRHEMHRNRAFIEMQKRQDHKGKKSTLESEAANSIANREPDYTSLLTGVGQGGTH